MIAIDQTLVSEEIIKRKFVCDLNACKGACCVAGESGAPLTKNELTELRSSYPAIKPFMTPEGIEAVEKQGVFVVDSDGDDTTPLVDGKQCAFAYFKNDIAFCAIEEAWNEKKIKFQKPISCHLYPVRIETKNNYDVLTYEKWEVCKPACQCGQELNTPVYQFVKSALIRKYGKKWFMKLDAAAHFLAKKKR